MIGRAFAGAWLGAALGARAGLVYGAVEQALATLLPALRETGAPAAHAPGALLVLLAVYALAAAGAGAALGALAGAARGRALGAAEANALVVLGLALAFTLHLLRHVPPEPPAVALVAACGALAASLAASAIAPRRARPLRLLASPWSAAVLLVGACHVVLAVLLHAPPAARVGAALAIAVAGGGAGLAGGLLTARRRGAGGGPRPARALAGAALAAAGVAAAGAPALRVPAPELPAPGGGGAHGDRPNVLLITLDTVRADHLSVYGYERPTTPRLEAFAREAAVYTRAVASSDMTLATHASLFTGLYARRHGARVDPLRPSGRLLDRHRTLAEALRDAGYRTLAVVANPTYLTPGFGFAQGFDHYDARPARPWYGEAPRHLLVHAAGRAIRALAARAGWTRVYEAENRRAPEINEAALTLLERAAAGSRPFFLFLNYMDAHWPYRPPPPFDDRFAGRTDSDLVGEGAPLLHAVLGLERELSAAERAHLASQYDGELAFLDRHLGRLFDELRRLGVFERTLIVVTSDHGEALGRRRLITHGISVYEDVVRVPLLIRRPGPADPRVVEATTSTVDVLPTVLDAAGLPIPPGVAGRSLLEAAPDPDRLVISESYPDAWLHRLHPRFRRRLRAVYAGGFKLIASTNGRRELYDLERDPDERHDLYGSDAAGARAARARLEAELDAWLERDRAAPTVPAELDEATLERLRALGYGRP